MNTYIVRFKVTREEDLHEEIASYHVVRASEPYLAAGEVLADHSSAYRSADEAKALLYLDEMSSKVVLYHVKGWCTIEVVPVLLKEGRV